MIKIAILDDWQDVARSSADWSPLASRANLTFFADAFDTEDEAAAALADFEILLTMRERTAFPGTLLRRLPKLRMIGITGAHVATLVRIPIQSGRGFRFQAGHHSDLMPATIPR